MFSSGQLLFPVLIGREPGVALEKLAGKGRNLERLYDEFLLRDRKESRKKEIRLVNTGEKPYFCKTDPNE